MIKTIRIILLILIILGLGALATEKLWVPKLVNWIIAREGAPVVVPVLPAPVQPNVTLADGEQCYTFDHEATKDEPYTTTEFINITITGNKVTGTKTGTQSGPDMNNGYEGTITGTLANNAITDIFSYTIEGSQNKEAEIYRAGKVGLEKLRYPLVEKSGVLVPDTTKDYKVLTYARVECEGSN